MIENTITKLQDGERFPLSSLPRWDYMQTLMDLRNERIQGQYTFPQTLYPGKELVLYMENPPPPDEHREYLKRRRDALSLIANGRLA